MHKETLKCYRNHAFRTDHLVLGNWSTGNQGILRALWAYRKVGVHTNTTWTILPSMGFWLIYNLFFSFLSLPFPTSLCSKCCPLQREASLIIQADGRKQTSIVSLTHVCHTSNRTDSHYSSSGNSVILVTNHLLISLKVCST